MALLLLAAGCGGGDSQAQGYSPRLVTGTSLPGTGGRLVVGLPAESNGWNPYLNQWTDSVTMAGSSMIESFTIQDNDGRAQPWLIEHWESDPEFTVWTLSVRPGVVFHDGAALDAQVVKKNLDSSLEGPFHKVVKSLYESSEVIAPLKVRVRLSKPWAQYPVALANSWALAPAMLDRTDAGVSNPVGTGPFAFVSWNQGTVLKTRRWERYWRTDAEGRALPRLDEVEFRPIPDDRLRERDLRSGAIDLAFSAAGPVADIGGDFDVIKDYHGQRTFLMLNTAVGAPNKGNPLVNVHARRALAYATDRERMARLAGKDVRSTTFGYRPDSPWAPEGDDGYMRHDPVRAREEVDRYKRDTGAKELRFTVLGLASPESQATLQALTEDWEKVGIRAEITTVDAAKLTLLTALGSYQAAWFRMWDFPDPDQMLFFLTSANVRPIGEISVNFTHYSSPRLDKNLDVVRESSNYAARKAANDDIIRETNQQVLSLWLYDTPASLVAGPHVEGLDGYRSHSLANLLPKPWIAEVWLAR